MTIQITEQGKNYNSRDFYRGHICAYDIRATIKGKEAKDPLDFYNGSFTNKGRDITIHGLKKGSYTIELRSMTFMPIKVKVKVKAGKNTFKKVSAVGCQAAKINFLGYYFSHTYLNFKDCVPLKGDKELSWEIPLSTDLRAIGAVDGRFFSDIHTLLYVHGIPANADGLRLNFRGQESIDVKLTPGSEIKVRPMQR